MLYLHDPTGSDVNDLTWNEAVALQSGELVAIRRHTRFRTYSVWGLGGASSGPVGEKDSINIVGDTSFIKWEAPVRPMLLDRDEATHEWLIVAASYEGSMWGNNGAPCPPQWAFRLRGGAWHVQPVPAALLGRRPNLLMDLRVEDDAKFTADKFGAEGARRKAVQTSENSGLPYGQSFVGDLTMYRRLCEGMAPRFLKEFLDKDRAGISLADFPRMTE